MKIGNLLMSGIFVWGGLGALKEPGGRVGLTKDFLSEVGLSVTDDQAETLVKVNGAVMVGAGAAVGLGLFPRLSALALIGSLAPTTLAGHAFWKAEESAKNGQTIQFLKNLAIAGGLANVALSKPKRALAAH